jgi:hypothetical protein
MTVRIRGLAKKEAHYRPASAPDVTLHTGVGLLDGLTVLTIFVSFCAN